MTMSICDIILTSGSWDWTNQTLMSSWQRTLSSRKKSSRIVYHFSINHNNAMFILWQLKNWSFRRLFFQLLLRKICIFFQTELHYLKVISNIENIYWGRCNKMSPNWVRMYTAHSLKLRPENLLGTSCPNGALRMSLKRSYVVLYKAEKCPSDKNFCINVVVIKLSSQHNRLTMQKERIRITCLKLNSQAYIFLSSKILSNSIWSLSI